MLQEVVRSYTVSPAATAETPFMRIRTPQGLPSEFEIWRKGESTDLFKGIRDFSRGGSRWDNLKRTRKEYRTLAERERGSSGVKDARLAYIYYTTIYELGMTSTDIDFQFCQKMRSAHLSYLLKHSPRPSLIADYITLHTGFDALFG